MTYSAEYLSSRCLAECGIPEARTAYAQTAITASIDLWPTVPAQAGSGWNELQARKEAKRREKEHRRAVKVAVMAVYGDPLTFSILWFIISWVSGKVCDWLWKKYQDDQTFAAEMDTR